MKNPTTFVGMDAHKDFIEIAMLIYDTHQPVQWRIANESSAIRQMVRKVRRQADDTVMFCYEAGPCGYTLQRQLAESGQRCQVVAPSLIPRKPGERVKTDKRDAGKLAELLRAGLLTEVCPPTPQQEAVRDLCRCRLRAKQDWVRACNRVTKLLLRRGGFRSPVKKWSSTYWEWACRVRLEHQADQIALDDYLLAVQQVQERIATLDEKIEQLSEQQPYCQSVGWLRCLRGVDTLTAMILVTELHGVERFQSARDLMAYLGLVPSEYSSGGKRHQGGITKTGNSHVRRVLVEAAWHCRLKPAVTVKLRRRRQGQPAWVIAVADRAQQRLYRRFWRLLSNGKPSKKVAVAVAREFVGFVWSLLVHDATTVTG